MKANMYKATISDNSFLVAALISDFGWAAYFVFSIWYSVKYFGTDSVVLPVLNWVTMVMICIGLVFLMKKRVRDRKAGDPDNPYYSSKEYNGSFVLITVACCIGAVVSVLMRLTDPDEDPKDNFLLLGICLSALVCILGAYPIMKSMKPMC